MKYKFKDKLFLVTGGSGFLGKPLVKRLLDSGARVRVLARDHGKLGDLQLNFTENIDVIPGDVNDIVAVKKSLQGINGVFHLAASKHVTLAETQVRECVKSNTLGSLNLLEESLNYPLEFVLGISTDKAAQVAGVYGASKFLMERMFTEFQRINPKCDYR